MFQGVAGGLLDVALRGISCGLPGRLRRLTGQRGGLGRIHFDRLFASHTEGRSAYSAFHSLVYTQGRLLFALGLFSENLAGRHRQASSPCYTAIFSQR